MDSPKMDKSGLQCLQILFQQVRRNVNFASLITGEVMKNYQEKPLEILENLSDAQRLAPEKISSLEVFSLYNGPAILEKNEGTWVILLNSATLKDENGKTGFVDPAKEMAVKQLPAEEFKKLLTGRGLIFRNLAQVDAKK